MKNPGCYASALGDCTSKLSREHYFSKSVLEQIHPRPIVEGLPREEVQDKRYSIASLTAKILCTHHNAALSPLDSEAAKVFAAIDGFEQDSAARQTPSRSKVTSVSGPEFERWLLKVAFGLCKGNIVRNSLLGTAITSIRNEEGMLQVLFDQGEWPDHWGIYLAMPTQPVGAPANLGFEPRTNSETGELLILVAWLRVVEFWICLGKPAPVQEGQYRPGVITFSESGTSRTSALQFLWPTGEQHASFNLNRVGEQQGWANR